MAKMTSDLQLDERLHTQCVTPELVQYIADKIAKTVNPQKIILFGSWARNEATEYSDVDLFIIHDGEMSNREMYRRIARLFWGRLFGIDLIVRTPADVELNLAARNPFYTRHILREGRVLYERTNQAAR